LPCFDDVVQTFEVLLFYVAPDQTCMMSFGQ